MWNQSPYKLKSASQELIKLYTLMGEALGAVQLIEDALSHAISMKKDLKDAGRVSKTEANEHLKKYRKYTLGDAIKLVKKEKLFDENLEQKLDVIRGDRNWLIHRSLYQALDSSHDNMSFEHCKDELYIKIKTITHEANDIKHLISEDMLKFCEDQGADMSRARKAIKEHYG